MTAIPQSDLDYILQRLPDGVSFASNGSGANVRTVIAQTMALPEVNGNKWLCLATLYETLRDSVVFQLNAVESERLGDYSYTSANLKNKVDVFNNLIAKYQQLARTNSVRPAPGVVPRPSPYFRLNRNGCN